jgi:hypothetical protein
MFLDVVHEEDFGAVCLEGLPSAARDLHGGCQQPGKHCELGDLGLVRLWRV